MAADETVSTFSLHGTDERALEPDELQLSYRFLADSMPLIVWTARPDGYIDSYNQCWFDYIGLPAHHPEALDWKTVVHPDDINACASRWTASVHTGTPYEIECRFRRGGDGAYRWHLGRASARRDHNGHVVQWVGTSTDIDDYKRAQETLVRNQADIAALNMNLRQTMSTMHDRVRNTLQILTAMVDLMTFRGEEAVPAADVRQLGTHIHIMTAVQDLLMQQARTDGQANYLSARSVLDRLVPLFDGMARGTRVETEIEEIRLPAQQGIALPIVVNELVANAFRHGHRPGGTVQIGLHKLDGAARLTVSDDGPGFPAGFDPRQSARTGLELVDRLSKWDLLGETCYENLSEGGARVTITIPLSDTAAA